MIQLKSAQARRGLSPDQLQPREVVRILSGDPSRGALSLDMEEPLRTGQKVQVRSKQTPPKTYSDGHSSMVTLPSTVHAKEQDIKVKQCLDVRTGYTVVLDPSFGRYHSTTRLTIRGDQRDRGNLSGHRRWFLLQPRRAGYEQGETIGWKCMQGRRGTRLDESLVENQR